MKHTPRQTISLVPVLWMDGYPENWNSYSSIVWVLAVIVIKVDGVLYVVSNPVSYNGRYVVVANDPDRVTTGHSGLYDCCFYHGVVSCDRQQDVRIRHLKI